jgi:hypothetical protein
MAYDHDDPMPTPKDINEFRTKTADAIKNNCPQCHAPPNNPCTNRLTGRPLRTQIVHAVRYTMTVTEIEELF